MAGVMRSAIPLFSASPHHPFPHPYASRFPSLILYHVVRSAPPWRPFLGSTHDTRAMAQSNVEFVTPVRQRALPGYCASTPLRPVSAHLVSSHRHQNPKGGHVGLGKASVGPGNACFGLESRTIHPSKWVRSNIPPRIDPPTGLGRDLPPWTKSLDSQT